MIAICEVVNHLLSIMEVEKEYLSHLFTRMEVEKALAIYSQGGGVGVVRYLLTRMEVEEV